MTKIELTQGKFALIEFGIITEVRKKIRKNLEHDDILIAIQRLPTIRKLK